jgi:O-antigen/teichoic acid export membrane protein
MDIVRGLSSILGSQAGVLLLGILITPLLVRFLGSAQYGDYAFLLSILSVVMIFTNAGLFDGIRKHLSEDKSNSAWVQNVFAFYLRVAIFLAFVVVATLITFSWFGLTKRLLGESLDYIFIFLVL